MTKLEDRIRETFLATAERLPDADASTFTVAEPTRPRRFRSPAVIAIGAAVALLLVVIPSASDTRWERVGIDATASTVELYGVAPRADGLIAVGVAVGDDGRYDGAVLVSDDGVGWDRVAVQDDAMTTGAVLLLGGVIETDFGLIVLGGSCQDSEPCGIRPTVWFSSEGTAWELIPNDPDVFGSQGWIADATVTEAGVVAVGMRFDDNEGGFAPATWSSHDGLTWTLDWTGTVQPVFENQGMPIINGNGFSLMEAVTVTTEGNLISVGSVCDVSNAQYECAAAVWTSTDGKVWKRVPHDPSVFASETTGGQAVMTSIAGSDETLIAVGTDNGTAAAAWKSADGITWIRLELPQAMVQATELLVITYTVDGFLAAGPGSAMNPSRLTATAWRSPDGSQWTTASEFAPGLVVAIVPGGPGGIAVGSDPTNESGAIWVTR